MVRRSESGVALHCAKQADMKRFLREAVSAVLRVNRCMRNEFLNETLFMNLAYARVVTTPASDRNHL